jgi:hypothetical protein
VTDLLRPVDKSGTDWGVCKGLSLIWVLILVVRIFFKGGLISGFAVSIGAKGFFCSFLQQKITLKTFVSFPIKTGSYMVQPTRQVNVKWSKIIYNYRIWWNKVENSVYISNIPKAIISVIVEEHGLSRTKHDNCDLHALNWHEEWDIKNVFFDKPF